MIIKEKTIYEPQFSNNDIESLVKTTNMLHQFEGDRKAWDEIQRNNENLSKVSLHDVINFLIELGGEDFQKYLNRVRGFGSTVEQ